MTVPAPVHGEDFRGTKRFLVLRRLGAGGAGVVYEAFDRDHGARVALKALKKLQPDTLLRFKNEFRALQDIHHPNLVSLGELFEEGGQWFFTMEYVDGVDLLAYVNRARRLSPADSTEDRTMAALLADPPTLGGLALTPAVGTKLPDGGAPLPFDEKRIRSALAQLVRGVRALHAAGKVHRDIKASNILVTSEGRVVLLDFGLIMEARNAREEAQTYMVVGTEKYMAPEQAAALLIGPQADCYSVGVVLYRSLTGQFPFGDASGERLLLKQRQRPASPNSLVYGVPPDLEELCLDLLRASPDARPTCEQILERLHVTPAAHGESLPPNALVNAGPFVGREVELAILRDAFDEALRGTACAIAVTGESGLGKSTLARRFGELAAEETGAVVLASRCYERESVPYKAIDGIVDALSRVLIRMPAMDLADIMPRHATLLAQAFPVLRRVHAFADSAPASETSAPDPKERRARLFGAVRELLTKMANRLPVVVVIDDLQWSDADSFALLRDVLRPPDAPALLFLATARAAGEATPDAILAAVGGMRTLRLDRLDAEAARELARRLLDRVPWGGSEMADRIAREANGHPLFIDELVRHALLGSEERAWSARLEDAVTARVDRLDAQTRATLEAVCVAGGPLRIDVMAHATSMELGMLVRTVARLRTANLVRASGVRRVDSVEPYHDRVRDAVLARTADDVRRTWHRRIAMALEATTPADVDALITHWRGATDHPKAARYALISAAHASDALAFDRAARLFKLALSLDSASAEDVRAVRTNLGIALANAGRGAEAGEAFLAAAEGAPLAEAIDSKRRAAEQLLFAGHFDDGLVVLHDVMATLRMDVPRTNRSALASLLVRRGQLRLRGLDFKPRDASDCSEQDLRQIDMLAAVSGSLGMVDTIRGADFQTRHALLALKTGEPLRIVRALSLEAAYSATGGSRTKARTVQIVARAREVVSGLSDLPLPRGWFLSGAAAAAFLEGRWQEAFDLFSEAAIIFRERVAGQAWMMDSAHFYQLGALMHLGDLKELGRRIPVLLEEAAARGDRYALTHLRTGVLSIAWLARGDAVGARREADDAIGRWSAQGTHLPHFLDVLAQAQIDLYEGKPRAAYARVVGRWDALAKAFLLRVQFIRIKMLELRGRAAVAVAAASPAEAEVHLRDAERCAGEVEREATRYGAALAKMLRATIRWARGDATEAAKLLIEAEHGFMGERMALHVAVARRRLVELVDSERSALLAAASSTWMEEQAIADPERIAATIAPWREDGPPRSPRGPT